MIPDVVVGSVPRCVLFPFQFPRLEACAEAATSPVPENANTKRARFSSAASCVSPSRAHRSRQNQIQLPPNRRTSLSTALEVGCVFFFFTELEVGCCTSKALPTGCLLHPANCTQGRTTLYACSYTTSQVRMGFRTYKMIFYSFHRKSTWSNYFPGMLCYPEKKSTSYL